MDLPDATDATDAQALSDRTTSDAAVDVPSMDASELMDVSRDDRPSPCPMGTSAQDGGCVSNRNCAVNNGECGDRAQWRCVEHSGAASVCQLQCEADRAAILTPAITRIATPGALWSSVVAHGQNSCPLYVSVTAQNRATSAFARVGRGRVITFGHEALLGAAALNAMNDVGELVFSSLRWAAAGRAMFRVGLDPAHNFAGLRTFLMSRGLTVVPVAPDALAASNVDVWVTQNYATPDNLDAVRQYVEGGGGLLSAGQAWYWASQHSDEPLENYPGNVLLGAFGLLVHESTIGEAELTSATAATRLHQPTYALDRAFEHERGGMPLSAMEQVIVSDVVGDAVEVVPGAWEYMQNARRLLEGAPAIVPTRAMPVRKAVTPMRALLVHVASAVARTVPVEQLYVDRTSGDFPGEVPAAAPRVTVTRTIHASYAGRPSQYGYSGAREKVWRSLGLYAPPGAQITVTIPASATSARLDVQIGMHTDRLWDLAAWERVPQIVRNSRLSQERTVTGSPYGGLLYVRVLIGAMLGDISVTISGAVEAPRFERGITTRAQWMQSRTAPGPWAEIGSDKFIAIVPSSAIRSLDDPEPVTMFWDRVLDADATLSGLPLTRARAERFLIDRQISAGYMHSGYPIMAPFDEADNVVNAVALMTVGNWGIFHELGHNHQWIPWVLPGTTEATVNLFSVYCYETIVGRPLSSPMPQHPALSATERANRIRAYVAGGRNFARDWNVWTALETYLQLREAFGWEPFTQVFTEYRAIPAMMEPQSDMDKIQQWVLRSSRAVNRNLVPFYERWGFPIADATRTATAGLAVWATMPAMP